MTLKYERISIKLAGWNAENHLKLEKSEDDMKDEDEEDDDEGDEDEEDDKMNVDDSSFVVSVGRGSAQLLMNKVLLKLIYQEHLLRRYASRSVRKRLCQNFHIKFFYVKTFLTRLLSEKCSQRALRCLWKKMKN